MAVVIARNTGLTKVLSKQSMGVDFYSPIIDFKEMNVAFIQTIQTVPPDALDGVFSLYVSLFPEENTFVFFPDSERTLNDSCNNFGWNFCCLAFRYARVRYQKNSVTTGLMDIYTRAKRT